MLFDPKAIGIELVRVDFVKQYWNSVFTTFIKQYAAGLTPNPDILCNAEIKFKSFLDHAMRVGAEKIATGHYARVRQNTSSGLFELLKGLDPSKDQSYFLHRLNQAQLSKTLFPVGELHKTEVRRIAAEIGLPNAKKKDSTGICFIGEVKMADFLRAYVPDAPGPIVRADDGRVLGEHRGLHFYTLGQRKGIGVPSNTDHRAYVVVGKRAADRALLVAFDGPAAPGLFQTEVQVHALSWLAEPITAPARLEGRVRYRDPRVPLRFEPLPGGTSAHVIFEAPQRGLASGQVLALYDGERLLGGAVYHTSET